MERGTPNSIQDTHDVLHTYKGYTVPGNQGTHDKLNQIRKYYTLNMNNP